MVNAACWVRQASWPEGRYSALAGFLEAGESAEQALHREVFEETGCILRIFDIWAASLALSRSVDAGLYGRCQNH